jgi:exodeoxyribonuclease VII small subunit
MAAKKETATKEPFEKSLERLETIVNDLESGEKGLEDSLALFEEGVGLAKTLTHRLDEVKRKVEIVTKDAQGKLKVEPLSEDEDEGH